MFTKLAIGERDNGRQGRSNGFSVEDREKDECKKKEGVSESIVESVQGVASVRFEIRSWAMERDGKGESCNPAGSKGSEGKKQENNFCAISRPRYGITFPRVDSWGEVGGFRGRNRRAPGAVSAAKSGLLASSCPGNSSSGSRREEGMIGGERRREEGGGGRGGGGGGGGGGSS